TCPADALSADGAACDDGDLCTQGDTCQAGQCQGGTPVTCSASDQCHDAGVCDPATGLCSNPPKQDGTPCDDDNACTEHESCRQGRCSGGAAADCSDGDACTVDTCNPTAGCVHRHFEGMAALLSVRAVARRADEPRLRCAAGHPVGDELDGGAVEVGTAPWHPVPLAELERPAQLVHEEAFGGAKRVWPIVSSANGRSRTLV